MLNAIAGLSADASMRQVQAKLDACLRIQYGTGADASLFEHEPWERLQANAVVYGTYRHEAWLFGDCQIMVNGVQMPTVKRVDELLGELRSFAAQALTLQKESCVSMDSDEDVRPSDSANGPDIRTRQVNDPARDMILPFLRLQSQFANKTGMYGYFVFDGFTDPTYPIRTVPVHPGDEVVLASDGYPLLRPTLAESERELDRLRHDDPQLIRDYRTTKGFVPGQESFDDRTYMRFIA
ncbi:hypothetical protein CUU80_03400 [Bifidobacterium scaligerum]|uniref:Uncharacterized protein n=1 Tax=Bifidobacterium scaligerum TaxID=2052656 RepID=A0A2M9HRT8_9BIFI|nr:hypothetical protein CUU80_03400 [Bifidobacterium scaligerum]